MLKYQLNYQQVNKKLNYNKKAREIFIEEYKKVSLNKKLEIEGVLMTMYDSRTNLSNEVYSEVKKYFKEKVYKTTIPRNIRLAEAPSFGLPIVLYDNNCKGAEAYQGFTKEFLKRQEVK